MAVTPLITQNHSISQQLLNERGTSDGRSLVLVVVMGDLILFICCTSVLWFCCKERWNRYKTRLFPNHYLHSALHNVPSNIPMGEGPFTSDESAESSDGTKEDTES